MKIIGLLLLLAACQDYNSNSSDKARYGGDVVLENDPQFQQAYHIIQDRCVSCHTSQIHAPWSTYTTNAKWIESGRVIKGDPQGSALIDRIINTGETNSNMPLGGSALPNDEYDALVQWVQNIP